MAFEHLSEQRVMGTRPLFRTDRHGDVQISTDGHKLWIKTEKGGE